MLRACAPSNLCERYAEDVKKKKKEKEKEKEKEKKKNLG